MSGVSLDANFYHGPLKCVAGALINISSTPIEELKTKPTRFRYKVTGAPLSLFLISSSPPPPQPRLPPVRLLLAPRLPRLRSGSATQTLTQADLIGLSLLWEVWAKIPLPAAHAGGEKSR